MAKKKFPSSSAPTSCQLRQKMLRELNTFQRRRGLRPVPVPPGDIAACGGTYQVRKARYKVNGVPVDKPYPSYLVRRCSKRVTGANKKCWEKDVGPLRMSKLPRKKRSDAGVKRGPRKAKMDVGMMNLPPPLGMMNIPPPLASTGLQGLPKIPLAARRPNPAIPRGSTPKRKRPSGGITKKKKKNRTMGMTGYFMS